MALEISFQFFNIYCFMPIAHNLSPLKNFFPGVYSLCYFEIVGSRFRSIYPHTLTGHKLSQNWMFLFQIVCRVIPWSIWISSEQQYLNFGKLPPVCTCLVMRVVSPIFTLTLCLGPTQCLAVWPGLRVGTLPRSENWYFQTEGAWAMPEATH